MSKVKISFVLPESLQRDLKEKMVRDGYDLKGKSRWVSEAVADLLNMKTYADLVKLNDEMACLAKLESVVVEKEFKKMVDNAVVEVRKKYPAIEGVQSRIMRTAIVQRLLG